MEVWPRGELRRGGNSPQTIERIEQKKRKNIFQKFVTGYPAPGEASPRRRSYGRKDPSTPA